MSLVPFRVICAACLTLVGPFTPELSGFLVCKVETSGLN